MSLHASVCICIVDTVAAGVFCVLIRTRFLVRVCIQVVAYFSLSFQGYKNFHSFLANPLCCCCCCFIHALKRCYLKVGAQVQVCLCLYVATSAPIGTPICHAHCEGRSSHSLDTVCPLCCPHQSRGWKREERPAAFVLQYTEACMEEDVEFELN